MFNPKDLSEEAYATFMEKWAFSVNVHWQKSTNTYVHQLYTKEKGKPGLNGFALVLGRNGSKLEVEDSFGMKTSKIFFIEAKHCSIKHRRINAKIQDIWFHVNEEQYVNQLSKSAFDLW